MPDITVQQMADRVAQLMEDRLRIRGASLSEKLRKGGRYLPRKVRAGAAYLAQSAERAVVPKLQLQLDHRKISDAYDVCIRHLKPLGQGARRRALAMSVLTSVGLTVFVTAALVLVVLVWRGFV